MHLGVPPTLVWPLGGTLDAIHADIVRHARIYDSLFPLVWPVGVTPDALDQDIPAKTADARNRR